MKKLLVLFPLCFLLVDLSAQFTQTIRGVIIDKESEAPLIGANIIILQTDPIIASSTDLDGKFKLEKVAVGRHTLQVSYLGYQQQVLSNIEVVSGKETVLTIKLEEEAFESVEVTVTASKQDKEKALNEMAAVSTRQFAIEEAQRYAGARGDVSRMAANFAGVSGANDSRNDIIIRGNSPLGLLWRFEGVDIPNPNHFGGFGTTGGPVSMLNNNVLSNSDFFTGAFPSEYGNANSGVFDLRMRSGNNEKYEFMVQMGFNGLEAGAEGPLSKKKGYSFLANYRYSTLGLFKLMGIDFGLVGVPQYQDLVFKLDFPKTKAGHFSVFGLGGISSIDMLESTIDKEDIDGGYGSDLYSGTKMAVLGLKHQYLLNNNSYTRFTLAGTVHHEWTKIDQLDVNNENPLRRYQGDFLQAKATARFVYNNKVNSRLTLRFGLTGNYYYSNFTDSVRIDSTQFRSIRSFDGHAGLTQVFAQAKYKLSRKFTILGGAYSQWFALNNSVSIEPRAAIQYHVYPQATISLAYGRHSQLQPFPIYFNQTLLPDFTYVESNKDLDFTYSQHAVLSYDQNIGQDFRIKLEGYFQHINNAPVQPTPSNYSLLNYGTDFGTTGIDSLVNSGLGRNYGVELTVEKFFSKGYYFLFTGSVFQSQYQGSNKKWRNTEFNNNYVINTLGGYEFKLGKNNMLSIDLKLTVAGGRRYTPIDLDASNAAGAIVYVEDETFERQYPIYIKPDLQISWRSNLKKHSQVFTVSLENFINRKNVLEYAYDDINKRVDTNYQLGIFPMAMYRVEF
ncbi:MAG: TonB-dependent receptor [Aureispira sp.]|nr:TonB-dependent receptor [Aureispira sp.]